MSKKEEGRMLVPMNEMKKDDLSRLEKMKQLPKQLKFILQTDRKYEVEARRKVRLLFSSIFSCISYDKRFHVQETRETNIVCPICTEYVCNRFVTFSRRTE